MVSINMSRSARRPGARNRRTDPNDPFGLNQQGPAVPFQRPGGGPAGSPTTPTAAPPPTVPGGVASQPPPATNGIINGTVTSNAPGVDLSHGQGGNNGLGSRSGNDGERDRKPIDTAREDLASGNVTTNPTVDELIEENVRKYLGPNEDNIAAEQKALADQENATLGRNVLNQRASMGRAGFGASGALAGMEADSRAAAARQLGLDQSAIREREQNQAFQQFQGATQADIEKQRLAQQQAQADAQLAYLKAILAGDEPPATAATPETSPSPSNRSGGGSASGTTSANVASGFDENMSPGDAVGQAAQPGQGWKKRGFDQNGNVYWDTPQGVYMTPPGTG